MPIQHDSTVAAEATSTNQMATILKLTYREKKENETPKKKHSHPVWNPTSRSHGRRHSARTALAASALGIQPDILSQEPATLPGKCGRRIYIKCYRSCYNGPIYFELFELTCTGNHEGCSL